MAQKIHVNPKLLRSISSELQERAGRILQYLGSVDQEVRTLPDEIFDGIAADAFRTEYQTQARRLWKMVDILYTFGDDLTLAAQEFEQADQELASRQCVASDEAASDGPPGEVADGRGDQANNSSPDLSGKATDAEQRAVSYAKKIDSFNVESNAKYQKNRQGRGETYCNIFAADVARSMGADIPEWLDFNHDGRIDDYLNANEMVRWLDGSYDAAGVATGPDLGWKEVDASSAAIMANRGNVVIAGWNNSSGIGHMAVVRPDSEANNIVIAQAGAHNANSERLVDGFGPGKNIQFFVYEI